MAKSKLLAVGLLVVGLFLVVPQKGCELPSWVKIPEIVVPIVEPTYLDVVSASTNGMAAVKVFIRDDAQFEKSKAKLQEALNEVIKLCDTDKNFVDISTQVRETMNSTMGLQNRLDWDFWFQAIEPTIQKQNKVLAKDYVLLFKAALEGLSK